MKVYQTLLYNDRCTNLYIESMPPGFPQNISVASQKCSFVCCLQLSMMMSLSVVMTLKIGLFQVNQQMKFNEQCVMKYCIRYIYYCIPTEGAATLARNILLRHRKASVPSIYVYCHTYTSLACIGDVKCFDCHEHIFGKSCQFIPQCEVSQILTNACLPQGHRQCVLYRANLPQHETLDPKDHSSPNAALVTSGTRDLTGLKHERVFRS